MRWPGLMGRSLKSNGRSNGRKIGESDLIDCQRSGQAASETSLFINNGHVASSDECRDYNDVIGSKERIEAKHSKKALRGAYK